MPQNNNDRPSIEAIQAALTFIPPNDRPLWLKVGMALKVELGDAGFDVFDTWSQNAETYDVAAVKSAWKSFKTGGKISIGTLIFEATQRGFKLKDHAPATPISAEEAASIKQERAQRLAADQAEIERKQAAAASIAVAAWDKASEGGQSAYLENKRIAGHGVRFAGNKVGAALLVPVRDDSGKLWNIQRVFANGDKRFYTGGRVSGCFHVLGDLAASE
jgi:putative DNA primase/helicase